MPAGEVDVTAQKDFSVEQGSDWAIGLTISNASGPINIQGYSGVLKVATGFGKTSKTIVTSTAVIIDAASGKMSVGISADQSLSIPMTAQTMAFQYQFYLIRSDGSKLRILQGTLTLSAAIV